MDMNKYVIYELDGERNELLINNQVRTREAVNII